jgi:WD40 repeat protein
MSHVSRWQHRLVNVPVDIACSPCDVGVVTSDGDVVFLDRESGELRNQFACEGGALTIATSPSGHRWTIGGPFGAWLWGTDTNQATELNVGSWCSSAQWITDDRCAVAEGKQVRVVDAQGQQLWQSPPFPSTVADVCWLGGRHRLAIAVYGGVYVAEPRDRGALDHLPFKGSLLALATSPNGKWIVSGNQDASLQVFRPDNDDRLEMQGYPDKICRVSFHSTGRYLANDGAPEISVWDFGGAGPRGRSPVLCISSHESNEPTGFAWHPHLPLLVIGWKSGEITWVDVEKGIPGKTLRGQVVVEASGDPVTSVRWFQDDVIHAHHSGVIGGLRMEMAS